MWSATRVGRVPRRAVSRLPRHKLPIETLETRLLFSTAYSITALGSLGGGTTTVAAINNAGEITGDSNVASGVGHAFIWAKRKFTDLGTLYPNSSTFGQAINGAGDVAGYGFVSPTSQVFHAFVSHDGIMKDLGVLPGYTYSEAQGIDAAGQIVGYCSNDDPSFDEAFVYANGKMTDLGPMVGGISNANAINDSGTAVGYGTGSNGNPESFTYKNGKASLIGAPQYDNYSTADAINSTGTEIGGTAGLYLFDDSAAFIYKNGKFTSFNSLSPYNSNVTGINAAGVAVGNYELASIVNGTSAHTWVYPGSGTPVDLDDLVDPSLGVQFNVASGINDGGQIIASDYLNNGTASSYVLTPVASGSISGTVYNDLNGDGKRQTGETGLAGRTVYIDANHDGQLDGGEFSAVTDANGHYAFSGLAPGTYSVSEVPVSDWHTTAAPTNVKLASGQNVINADLGNQQMYRYTVTNITGVQSIVEVTGFNDSGEVVGDLVTGGFNFVQYGFLFANNHFTLIGNSTQQASGLTINAAGQINGLAVDSHGNTFYFLYSNGKLIPDKEPANYGAAMNAHGDYGGALNFSIERGPSWSTAYVVINGKRTVLGPTDDPNVSSGIVAINNLDQALGDGQISYTGPNGVFIYSNGIPHWMPNVPENANDLNDAGAIVGTYTSPTSQSQDAYLYSNGQVVDLNQAIPANTGLSLISADYINNGGAIVAEATDAGPFAEFPNQIVLLTPVLGSVSGSVFNDVNRNGSQQPGEGPLSGIRVYADVNGNHRWDPGEPFAVTNAAGKYTIANVPSDGVVIREVVQPGWMQALPSSQAGTWADISPGQNVTISPFAQSAIPSTITGAVFNDQNGDGIREAGEPGLANILVYVDLGNRGQFEDGDPFATTNSAGDYTLTNLQPGNDVIRSQVAAGSKQTTPAIGVVVHGGQQLLVSAIGQKKG